MLTNGQPPANIKSFHSVATAAGESQGWRRRPRFCLPLRLSSGISANILDFRIPQKHVWGRATMQTSRRAGGGGGPGVTNSATAQGARAASIREKADGGSVR